MSAFLKGITGLGFSTICLGILASFVDLKTTIPLVIIPSLSSNILVMIDARKFTKAVRRFWPIYLGVMPGLVIGLWILGTVESTLARGVLGLVLFAYGLWGLWNAEFVLPEFLELWLSGPVGFITGIINGITGSQVMPVLPYLLSLDLEKNTFVQAINISFTISSLIMLAGLGQLGLLSWKILGLSFLGILPVAFGIWLGSRLRRTLSERKFKKMVLLLLVILGLNLVVRTYQ